MKDLSIGGTKVPEEINKSLWDFVETIDESTLNNGRTSLFFHLLYTIESHLKVEE